MKNIHNCPNCGGQLEGDGYTLVIHCESVDLLDLDETYEPDANPVYCKDKHDSNVNKMG